MVPLGVAQYFLAPKVAAVAAVVARGDGQTRRIRVNLGANECLGGGGSEGRLSACVG